jgi:S-formylglutathione hydrolase FrmB
MLAQMKWIAVMLAACAAPAPKQQPSHSRIEYVHRHSEALGVAKTYLVYVPTGYDDNPALRWPVFYYLHGLTSPETEWVTDGKLDETADQLALAALVVMPDADDGFYIDSPTPIDYDACLRDGTGLYAPQADPEATCVRHRAYETYIATELVARIDATYRTIATRDGRAIAGVSMGGYGALSLGLRHPDEYAAIASHSAVATLLYEGPQPFAPGQARVAQDLDKAMGLARARPWIKMLFGPDIATWRAHDPAVLVQALPAHPPALYLDAGIQDPLTDTTRFVDELLTARKVDHTVFYGPGKHDYTFWVPRLALSLAFLRDHTAKPH